MFTWLATASVAAALPLPPTLYQKQPGRAGAAEVTGSFNVAGRTNGAQNNPYASAASAVSTEQVSKATCRMNSGSLISQQMRGTACRLIVTGCGRHVPTM
jgi:hypothetical protein